MSAEKSGFSADCVGPFCKLCHRSIANLYSRDGRCLQCANAADALNASLNRHIDRRIREVAASPNPVTRPAHYTTGALVQPRCELCEAHIHPGMTICESCWTKYPITTELAYICRARHKGAEKQDLEKAIEILRRRIAQMEGM